MKFMRLTGYDFLQPVWELSFHFARPTERVRGTEYHPGRDRDAGHAFGVINQNNPLVKIASQSWPKR